MHVSTTQIHMQYVFFLSFQTARAHKEEAKKKKTLMFGDTMREK